MNKINNTILAAVLALAVPAAAAGMRSDVFFDPAGRAEYGLTAEKHSAQFPWNASSRSLQDKTRLMLDARAGVKNYGALYVKGAAVWADPGSPVFELEQGDYFWIPAASDSAYAIRIFANERRYFTGELSEPVLDDDAVVRRGPGIPKSTSYGGRLDGTWSRGYHGSVLGSVLGSNWEQARKMYFLRFGVAGRNIQASAAYVFNSDYPDSLDNHAIIKGELTGFYRKLSVIVSFEQSAFDHRAFFLPSGRFDFDGLVGNNFSSALPAGAAAFTELRLTDLQFRDLGYVTFAHSYHARGSDHVNSLGPRGRESVSRSSGLYFAARDVAIDGRLVYTKSAWREFGIKKRERVEADVQGFLKNGSEVVLRGASVRTAYVIPVEETDNFVHAAYKRAGNKVSSGFHVMAKDINGRDFDRRFAAEARFNWTTELAFYCRLVTIDEYTSHDALYCRLELRPSEHVFATFAWGRDYIGDGPFVLEDPDVEMTGDTDPVYTITLRGDF